MFGGGVTCDGLKHKLQGKKYYDLVAHWVENTPGNIYSNTSDVSLKSQVLVFEELSGPENAENVRGVLSYVLESKFVVSLDTLLTRSTFVTDCASTLPCVVGASVSSSKLPFSAAWMGCISHQLNTCMKKVLSEKAPDHEPFSIVKSHLAAVKTIVRIFKQSNVMLDSNLMLIQEVETRFSTTFVVVRRFLRYVDELRDYILLQPSDSPLSTALRDLQFDVSSDGFPHTGFECHLHNLYKLLKEMQTAMEASRKPTLHRLLPMLQYCKTYLKKIESGSMISVTIPCMQEADLQISCSGLYFRVLSDMMLQYLEDIEVHPLWSAGCILRPRMRLMTCVSDPAKRELYMRSGKEEIRKLLKQGEPSVHQNVFHVDTDFAENERAERRLQMSSPLSAHFTLESALDNLAPFLGTIIVPKKGAKQKMN